MVVKALGRAMRRQTVLPTLVMIRENNRLRENTLNAEHAVGKKRRGVPNPLSPTK
jgi:hypothetical protein